MNLLKSTTLILIMLDKLELDKLLDLNANHAQNLEAMVNCRVNYKVLMLKKRGNSYLLRAAGTSWKRKKAEESL